jgi:two-component system OmpR family response regulator
VRAFLEGRRTETLNTRDAMHDSTSATKVSKHHLLIVDDDPDIAALVVRYFSAQGFRVSPASDGTAMREMLARDASVDLVLLDLGLPGEDGFDLTRYLRQQWRGPVIIVTGRGESVDRVVGLELGADDYVTKPFDLRELLARVRTVLRRTTERGASPTQSDSTLVFSGFRLDARAYSLTDRHGVPVDLTSGEFALLKILVEHPNRVLSRDDLMTHLHGRDAGPFDRAIDVQISRLRRKIEVDPARPEIIKSVRGAGYLFAAQVRHE